MPNQTADSKLIVLPVLIAIELGDVLNHLLRETRVGIDRNGLAGSDFALSLVEEGSAF
jgi:hypothetical protein